MIINLAPQYRPDSAVPVVSVVGEVLTIDGQAVDTSVIPEGPDEDADGNPNPRLHALIPTACRINGVVHLTMILPYQHPAPPPDVMFPDPVTNPPDGPIALPWAPGIPSPEDFA